MPAVIAPPVQQAPLQMPVAGIPRAPIAAAPIGQSWMQNKYNERCTGGAAAAHAHARAAAASSGGKRGHHDDGGSLVAYTCKFPGCAKVYASSDGARKHARNHHPEWLKQVEVTKRGLNCTSTYCIRTESPRTPAMMSKIQTPLPFHLAVESVQRQQLDCSSSCRS